jgi:hypothetical protein
MVTRGIRHNFTMKKSTFVFLVSAVGAVIAVAAAAVTLLVVTGKAPSPVTLGALAIIGPLVGIFAGSKFWDDREALRQRALEEMDSDAATR